MARTSASDVQAILKTDLTASELQPFVDDANVFVDSRLASQGLDASLLQTIEKYLAAHLASMRDPRLSSARRESANLTYEGESSEGLAATRYGQQAIELDPTGNLKNGTETAVISTHDLDVE